MRVGRSRSRRRGTHSGRATSPSEGWPVMPAGTRSTGPGTGSPIGKRQPGRCSERASPMPRRTCLPRSLSGQSTGCPHNHAATMPPVFGCDPVVPVNRSRANRGIGPSLVRLRRPHLDIALDRPVGRHCIGGSAPGRDRGLWHAHLPLWSRTDTGGRRGSARKRRGSTPRSRSRTGVDRMVRTRRQRDGHLGDSRPVVRVAVLHELRAAATRCRPTRRSSLRDRNDR